MQLIMLPNNRLHMYHVRGKVGDEPKAEEKVEERTTSIDETIKDFGDLFKELTGNAFVPWEREKKLEKQRLKFFPPDIVSSLSPFFSSFRNAYWVSQNVWYE